jgi:thiamine-phosphate pyrophosphorylase
LEKYRECLAIRELTSRAGALFIVNDDPALAIAVKADGVHIGQDDMPIEAARSVLGAGMIIGVSTHSPEQALDAVRRGADYIGVGPLFVTSTKTDVCAPVGLEYLEFAVKNIGIPFVAIGGIKRHNLPEVVKTRREMRRPCNRNNRRARHCRARPGDPVYNARVTYPTLNVNVCDSSISTFPPRFSRYYSFSMP